MYSASRYLLERRKSTSRHAAIELNGCRSQCGPAYQLATRQRVLYDTTTVETERYISLTPDYLYYYSDQKVRPTMIPCTHGNYIMYVWAYVYAQKGEKKGEFPVNRMRIVEKVPDSTFHTSNCMQVSCGLNHECSFISTLKNNG